MTANPFQVLFRLSPLSSGKMVGGVTGGSVVVRESKRLQEGRSVRLIGSNDDMGEKG